MSGTSVATGVRREAVRDASALIDPDTTEVLNTLTSSHFWWSERPAFCGLRNRFDVAPS